jgi:hypothetical protein
MNLIGVHREYEDHAEGYRQSNTALINISKVKPKAVGEKGLCKLNFDIWRNGYYEDRGERFYLPTPFIKSEPEIQNNNDIQTFTSPLPF